MMFAPAETSEVGATTRNILSCGAAAVFAALVWAPSVLAQSVPDTGPGRCVEESGTCGDPGSSYTRTYVDPAEREARRAAREAERRERRRIREVRKRNRTPYRGVSTRRADMRKSIRTSLARVVDSNSAVVKSVTYERVPGFAGEIFVPDNGLGNVALARPVNPTLTETKIAAEQLAKAGAVMNFLRAGRGSAEDAAFLADQAAQIMVGGRSYVHVGVGWGYGTVNGADGVEYFESKTAQLSEKIEALQKIQLEIRESETQRAEILETAKGVIFELAGLEQKISDARPGRRKDRMENKAKELSRTLDTLEKAYFDKRAREKRLETEAAKTGNELITTVRWRKKK